MTAWNIYLARPKLQFLPGSAHPSCGLVEALMKGECEIEDHGKSKGVNEGYATHKVSVKAAGRTWETYRLRSQKDVDTFTDWLIAVPQRAGVPGTTSITSQSVAG